MLKKSFLVFLVLTTMQVFGQKNAAKILGIWQAKLNGKFLTGKDLGTTLAPYSNHNVFYIFGKESCYISLAPNKTSLTKASLPGLIKKQVAGEGTYAYYDSLPLIPENIRTKFENQGPFKPNTAFVEGNVQNEASSFYFEPATKKLYGLNKEVKLELIYVGPF